MKLKLSAVLVSAVLMASCSNSEVVEINRGNEITFNTHVSRAADITTGNLNAFKVWAIWPSTGTNLIDGVVATKESGKSYFSLERAVFWANDVTQLNFWGVAPTTIDGISVTSASTSISDFKPDAKNLSAQKDLVVAYKEQERTNTTNVALNFYHALSQIEVLAKAGVDDAKETKSVKIKGAWIMNVLPEGNLSMTGGKHTDDSWRPVFDWRAKGTKTFYGKEFTNPVDLTHGLSYLLASENANSNMLLVPQELDTWNIASDDKETNPNKGAYLVFLCRVEATHDGALHEGASDPSVKVEGGKHTHQMFPYTGAWNEDQYGYTCVPINTKWEPGKKYVYTLTFCGQTSGAGIYPPASDLKDLPGKKDGETELYIKEPVEGKTAGDAVLDNPISFEVKVTDWIETDWTPGT